MIEAKIKSWKKIYDIYIYIYFLQSPREYTEHERRQLLIARLPNVETLNGGGVISSQEREDAERAFIRHYMDKPEAERPTRYGERSFCFD